MDFSKDEIQRKFGEHVKNLRIKFGHIVLNSSKITTVTVSEIEN